MKLEPRRSYPQSSWHGPDCNRNTPTDIIDCWSELIFSDPLTKLFKSRRKITLQHWLYRIDYSKINACYRWSNNTKYWKIILAVFIVFWKNGYVWLYKCNISREWLISMFIIDLICYLYTFGVFRCLKSKVIPS